MQRLITLRDKRSATIREAKVSDAPEFIRHRIKTRGETDFLGNYADEVTLTVADEEHIIEEIAANPRRILLVCVLEGTIIGFAGVSPASSFPKCAHRAVCALSVERAFWGQGVGSKLLSACITNAKNMGFEALELGCYAENERGLRLYERAGFRRWGICPQAMKHRDGTYHDEVQMTLDLKQSNR